MNRIAVSFCSLFGSDHSVGRPHQWGAASRFHFLVDQGAAKSTLKLRRPCRWLCAKRLPDVDLPIFCSINGREERLP